MRGSLILTLDFDGEFKWSIGACIMGQITKMLLPAHQFHLDGAKDIQGGHSTVGEDPWWHNSCNTDHGGILYGHGRDLVILDVSQDTTSNVLLPSAFCFNSLRLLSQCTFTSEVMDVMHTYRIVLGERGSVLHVDDLRLSHLQALMQVLSLTCPEPLDTEALCITTLVAFKSTLTPKAISISCLLERGKRDERLEHVRGTSMLENICHTYSSFLTLPPNRSWGQMHNWRLPSCQMLLDVMVNLSKVIMTSSPSWLAVTPVVCLGGCDSHSGDWPDAVCVKKIRLIPVSLPKVIVRHDFMDYIWFRGGRQWRGGENFPCTHERFWKNKIFMECSKTGETNVRKLCRISAQRGTRCLPWLCLGDSCAVPMALGSALGDLLCLCPRASWPASALPWWLMRCVCGLWLRPQGLAMLVSLANNGGISFVLTLIKILIWSICNMKLSRKVRIQKMYHSTPL